MSPDLNLIRQFARAADDGATISAGYRIVALDLDIAARDREIAAHDWAIAAECRRSTAALRASAAHVLSPPTL
jgi:hypothetical protein